LEKKARLKGGPKMVLGIARYDDERRILRFQCKRNRLGMLGAEMHIEHSDIASLLPDKP